MLRSAMADAGITNEDIAGDDRNPYCETGDDPGKLDRVFNGRIVE